MTSQKLNEMLGNINTSSALEAFKLMDSAIFLQRGGGELPAGRSQPVTSSSSSSSNANYPFKDSEIERELNELRKRTNDF